MWWEADAPGIDHAELVRRGILDEILAIYDDWQDMAEGPGEYEIAGVQMRYKAEGLDPAQAEADLREYMRRHCEARRAADDRGLCVNPG